MAAEILINAINTSYRPEITTNPYSYLASQDGIKKILSKNLVDAPFNDRVFTIPSKEKIRKFVPKLNNTDVFISNSIKEKRFKMIISKNRQSYFNPTNIASNNSNLLTSQFELREATENYDVIDLEDSYVFFSVNAFWNSTPSINTNWLRQGCGLEILSDVSFPIGKKEAIDWNCSQMNYEWGSVILWNLKEKFIDIPDNWKMSPTEAWYTGINLKDLFTPVVAKPSLDLRGQNIITPGGFYQTPLPTAGTIPCLFRIPLKLLCPVNNSRFIPTELLSILTFKLHKDNQIRNFHLQDADSGVDYRKLTDVQFDPTKQFLCLTMINLKKKISSSQFLLKGWSSRMWRDTLPKSASNNIEIPMTQYLQLPIHPAEFLSIKLLPDQEITQRFNSLIPCSWIHGPVIGIYGGTRIGPIMLRLKNLHIDTKKRNKQNWIDFQDSQILNQNLYYFNGGPDPLDIAQRIFYEYDFGDVCVRNRCYKQKIFNQTQNSLYKLLLRQQHLITPATNFAWWGFTLNIPINPNNANPFQTSLNHGKKYKFKINLNLEWYVNPIGGNNFPISTTFLSGGGSEMQIGYNLFSEVSFIVKEDLNVDLENYHYDMCYKKTIATPFYYCIQ